MIKGSEKREADHPIEPLILDRWSPRAMSGERRSDGRRRQARWERNASRKIPES
jgi:hypothetical protein